MLTAPVLLERESARYSYLLGVNPHRRHIIIEKDLSRDSSRSYRITPDQRKQVESAADPYAAAQAVFIEARKARATRRGNNETFYS